MNKIKDLWKYTVSEQRPWAAMILIGLIATLNGALIGWANSAVPLAVTIPVGILSTLCVVAYPIWQTFFYTVELEVRMISSDHDSANKMAIQIRENAKTFGLKTVHECYPDPQALPLPDFLSPSPMIHPVHLVATGKHWRMRKFAAQLDETVKAVSGIDAQIQGISRMVNPFPGSDTTEP